MTTIKIVLGVCLGAALLIAPGAGSVFSQVGPRLRTDWVLVESKDRMDKTPVIILRKSSRDAASAIVIECAEGETAAYVITGPVQSFFARYGLKSYVRIKFGDSAPTRQQWGLSDDGTALVAPDGIAFAQQLAKVESFLFEFETYKSKQRIIEFDVTALDAKLRRVAQACDWESHPNPATSPHTPQ